MIVCAKCGRSNPDGTAWCQKPGCGAFLGADAAPQSTQMVATATGTAPIGPPAQPTSPAQATTSAQPVAVTAAARAVGTPAISPPARPSTATDSAQPMVGLVSPGSPSADSSEPGHPADVTIPPATPVQPAVPVGPVEPPPDGVVKAGDVTKGGERPAGAGVGAGGGGRGGGRGRGILVVLAVLAVVAVLVVVGGYFYLTHRRDNPTTTAMATAVATPTPSVIATQVPSGDVDIAEVSSFATYNGVGRPPKTLLDGKASTFWSASYRDKKPSIRFEFSKSQKVERIDIINGAAGKGFLDRPSAKNITLTFPGGRKQTVQLEDQLGTEQSVTIDAPNAVKWVELSVNSIYARPHHSNNMYLRTSIAEVTFFSAPKPAPTQ